MQFMYCHNDLFIFCSNSTIVTEMASCSFLMPSALWFVVCIFLSNMQMAFTMPEFQMECDFGNTTLVNLTASITGTLAPKFGNARQCHIKHRMSSGILRVLLNTTDPANDTVFYVVVMERSDFLFLGTADSTYLTNGGSYHFHTCPTKSSKEETELRLMILGTPENSIFQASVHLDQSSLRASDASQHNSRQIHVREDGLSHVLPLDVEESFLFELYQITATSEDATMECILIISQDCRAVQRQGMHNTRSEANSLRLSFTKFGRITLSQYSHPRIMAGRWYIGVYAKNKNLNHTQEKSVAVNVRTSFKYDSMAGKSIPTVYMFLATLLGGTAIAMFAHFFLNSDFEETSLPLPDELDDNLEVEPIGSSTSSKYAVDPLPNTVPFKGWLSVICIHWFGRGKKHYSYITGVLAISFMVGSAQFVIALWSNMIKSGNRDVCYYNEGCYRPIAISDIPSNFLISNVPYVILGVVLALSFSFREAISREHKKQKASQGMAAVNRFIPYDYSLSYAFSWALVFEGLFSATYHLCPSRLTFQFDSAFMFIISGLVVVALYNSRVSRFLLTGQDETQKPPSETFVQAPKYFLFFVAPLLILNYVGSVMDTEGLPYSLVVMYWIALIMWILLMYCWMLKKVAVPWTLKECQKPEGALKWSWVIAFPICLLLVGKSKLGDWSQFFLFACVAAVALSIMGIFTLNLVFSCKQRRHRSILKDFLNPIRIVHFLLDRWHQILFSIVCFVFWVFAMYFFKGKPTTRKVAAPSFSRTFNHECALWDFFDYHDIWHMLSAFALFMSAYLLVYVTRKSEKLYYVESLYTRQNAGQSASVDVSVEEMRSPQGRTCAIVWHVNSWLVWKVPLGNKCRTSSFKRLLQHVTTMCNLW